MQHNGAILNHAACKTYLNSRLIISVSYACAFILQRDEWDELSLKLIQLSCRNNNTARDKS